MWDHMVIIHITINMTSYAELWVKDTFLQDKKSEVSS